MRRGGCFSGTPPLTPRAVESRRLLTVRQVQGQPGDAGMGLADTTRESPQTGAAPVRRALPRGQDLPAPRPPGGEAGPQLPPSRPLIQAPPSQRG